MRGTTKKPEPEILEDEDTEALAVTGEPGAAEPEEEGVEPFIPPFDCSGGADAFREEIPPGQEVPLEAGLGGCYEMINGKRVKVAAEQ